MKSINIQFKQNGFIVKYDGLLKHNGEYVYKMTEEFKMLEEIGLAVVEKKVEVKEK